MGRPEKEKGSLTSRAAQKGGEGPLVPDAQRWGGGRGTDVLARASVPLSTCCLCSGSPP